MSAFWENLADSYRPAAVSRRRLIPLRLVVVLVLCAMALVWPRLHFLLAWSGVFVVVQAAKFLALRHFLNEAAPGRAVALNLVSDFLMATIFGWLAIPLWAMDTQMGAAGAVLLLSGSIFTALMGAEGCLVAFVAAAAPHIAYLFVTPLVAGDAQDPVTVYFLIGCGLFCLTLSMVFLWSERAIAAERAARRAAERQTAAKSAFIAMVSHELRTPINAILNGAAALDRDGAAALVTDAGLMMRALLNDLLDLSKIEAGRMGVEVVDYDLPAVVGDAVEFWRCAAAAKSVALTLTGVETLPRWVRGDPMRTRQILNNLLSNAIKFTPEGRGNGPGEVTVDVRVERERPRQVAIVVRDTGPGLKDDQIERLFSPYEQLGAETARAFGGTGLGLSISRDLARLMGGELTAANVPDGGARFTLRLPAPEGAAPVEPPEDDVQALAVRDEAPVILVVDDHDINRRALRQMLEAFGARVETAEDAQAALLAAERQIFDAILMDVRMPGMDGLEASRRLREDGANRLTPIIAVTGGASPAEVAACREAGMTGWVEKPVNPRDLYKALFG
ncbi:ATP-binding protein [Caulobacter sp. FWC2]|uniref:ATP-binding protein n=1 Tax=Caulobacter sp. FWC2 TaxID=69664 RepID=UPI000C15F71E|nr:ATP-binding protein [Caulobacter sp. FWC2]PIB91943.1 hybrid sensor histidine kinase/response regulator [Caulobacter sp. FWC2]